MNRTLVMTITIERLVELRPWALHTTTPINFSAIRIWRRLRSAADLLTGTDYEHLLRSRRLETTEIIVDDVPVEIRDQRPLQFGHIRFEDNFTFADLLAELNTRVFFWLGEEGGPRERGQAHFRRYRSTGEVVVLRCPLSELLKVNGNGRAYVSASNSGAPRSNPVSGYAVRGRVTFQLVEQATFSPGKVQELSFRQEAHLPDSTEWSSGFTDPWRRIWEANTQS